MNIFELLSESGFPDDRMRSLGDNARDQMDWERCGRLYEKYLETDPENADIWVQLAHAYKEQGDLDLAERCYMRALSIAPLNPDTHLQLGHVEKLRGHRPQAMARYRKALDIAPDFDEALEECRRLTGVQMPTAELVGATENSLLQHTVGELGASVENLTARLLKLANDTGKRLSTAEARLGQIEALCPFAEDYRSKLAFEHLEMERQRQEFVRRFGG